MLARLMKERGTKNKELAAHLSRPEEKALTEAYISQIKSGERGVSFDRIVEIAHFFGIDAGIFFQRIERRRLFRELMPEPDKSQQKALRDGKGNELFDKFTRLAIIDLGPSKKTRKGKS